jgi:hypothetical protein
MNEIAATTLRAGFAFASYWPPGGSAEDIGAGSYPTVEDAKGAASGFAAAKAGDYRNLRWEQSSDTTWCLMNGTLSTHVIVSWTPGDHMPGDGRNMELITEEENRQLTRCTATGWLAADDPSGDLCPCGRRHVTIRSWVSGSREGGQQ